MKEIKRTVETKVGNKWEVTLETTDREAIYTELTQRLIAKKLHKCSWIRKIEEYSNYDGTRTVKVYYDNNTKDTFIIEA